MEYVIIESQPNRYRAVFLNGKRTLRSMKTIAMLANVSKVGAAILVTFDGSKTRIQFGEYGWRISE